MWKMYCQKITHCCDLKTTINQLEQLNSPKIPAPQVVRFSVSHVYKSVARASVSSGRCDTRHGAASATHPHRQITRHSGVARATIGNATLDYTRTRATRRALGQGSASGARLAFQHLRRSFGGFHNSSCGLLFLFCFYQRLGKNLSFFWVG